MGPAENLLKNLNVTIDGYGFAGNIDEFQPPELAMKEEDFRAGGMDAPIGVTFGMEKMVASFVTKKQCHETLAMFGVKTGTGTIPLTLRGALESNDGTVTPVKISMRGKVMKIAEGAWKPGEAPTHTYTFTLEYYKREHAGQVTHEIDVPNMVRIVNGVDQMKSQREALGL